MPLSHSTVGLCSGKWQAIKAVPRGHWTPPKGVFRHLSFSFHKLHRQMQQADECATIGNCKISRLLFANDLVLLSSTQSGLQRALNIFADSSDTARIKISTAKTEVFHLSRNPDQCVLPANVATLKQVKNFKYLGVVFTSEGRRRTVYPNSQGQSSNASFALFGCHETKIIKN